MIRSELPDELFDSTVFIAQQKNYYTSQTTSPEHTSLMVSPPASIILFHIGALFCVFTSVLVCRYDKQHSTGLSALKICLEG